MKASEFLKEDDNEDLTKEILTDKIFGTANRLYNNIKIASDGFRIPAKEALAEDYNEISIEMATLILKIRRRFGDDSVTYKRLKFLLDYFKQ